MLIRLWGRYVIHLCPGVLVRAMMFILQNCAVYYLSGNGTMCVFALVDVFFSFVPYFFIPLPFMLVRRFGNLTPLYFLLGIFPVIVPLLQM